MVCEHDDNIKLKNSEDLTLEALNSPNVQVFILNDSTLMSFVELPILDSVAGVKTANSTVRLILREISGKFEAYCNFNVQTILERILKRSGLVP